MAMLFLRKAQNAFSEEISAGKDIVTGRQLYKDTTTGSIYYKEFYLEPAPGGGLKGVKKKILVRQIISFDDNEGVTTTVRPGMSVDDPNPQTTPLPNDIITDQAGLESARDQAKNDDPTLAVDPDATYNSYSFGQAGLNAGAQAFAYGVLAAASGLPDQLQAIKALQQEIVSLQTAITEEAKIHVIAGEAVSEALSRRSAALDAALSAVAKLPSISAADPVLALADSNVLFATPDPYLALRLKRSSDTIRNSSPERLPAKLKAVGFAAVRQADVESAMGNEDEAEAYVRIARIVADVGIGVDPVTGAARGLYELFTGRNLITGEPLSNLELGFATVNVMMIGSFGSVQKAVTSIAKLGRVLGGQVGQRVIRTVGEIATKWPNYTIDKILSWQGTRLMTSSDEVIALAKNPRSFIPVPNTSGTYVRVMPKGAAQELLIGGGRLHNKDPIAFITDAKTIEGITSRQEIARKLHLMERDDPTKYRDLINDVIVEFRFKSDEPLAYLATPFGEPGKLGPGFLPGGITAGGVPEWVIDADAIKKGWIDPADITIRLLGPP
jgi:hypothetical protein